MKIGDKVRIKLSLAGLDYAFCEGAIVTITQSKNDDENISINVAESLLRGGSAEAVDFREETRSDTKQNETADILPDNRTSIGADDTLSNETESGILRPDVQQGQSVSISGRRSDAKRRSELRKDAADSAEPIV